MKPPPTYTQAQKIATGIGLAAAAAGGILGFWPGHFTAHGVSWSCGSPWIRDHSGELGAAAVDQMADGALGTTVYQGNYGGQCDDALGDRGLYAGIIAAAGLATMLGARLTATP
jgi:hypothetical protein